MPIRLKLFTHIRPETITINSPKDVKAISLGLNEFSSLNNESIVVQSESI